MLIKMNGKIFEMTEVETTVYTITTKEQINNKKLQLAETDYKALKYAEGWYSEEEYAPIKAEREALREQIRQLENEIEETEADNVLE